jgi:hypothetical protein
MEENPALLKNFTMDYKKLSNGEYSVNISGDIVKDLQKKFVSF